MRPQRDEREPGDVRDSRDPRLSGEARDERDPRLEGDPRDMRDPLLPKDIPDVIDRKGFPSDRLLRALALGMVVLVIVASLALVGTVLHQGQQIADLNASTGNFVISQNEAQLCAQHDITVAVKKIGRRLGLEVSDIVVPDVTGLNCP